MWQVSRDITTARLLFARARACMRAVRTDTTLRHTDPPGARRRGGGDDDDPRSLARSCARVMWHAMSRATAALCASARARAVCVRTVLCHVTSRRGEHARRARRCLRSVVAARRAGVGFVCVCTATRRLFEIKKTSDPRNAGALVRQLGYIPAAWVHGGNPPCRCSFEWSWKMNKFIAPRAQEASEAKRA